MTEWGVRQVDGRIGGEQVAGLGIGEENVLRLRICAEGLDQAARQSPGAAAEASPVRKAVHGDRDRECGDGERRHAFVTELEVWTELTSRPEAPKRPEGERDQPAPEGHPGRPGGRRAMKAVAEVTRVDELEHDPGRKREG